MSCVCVQCSGKSSSSTVTTSRPAVFPTPCRPPSVPPRPRHGPRRLRHPLRATTADKVELVSPRWTRAYSKDCDGTDVSHPPGCPARLSMSSPELLSELRGSRTRSLRHVVPHSGMTTVFSGRGRGRGQPGESRPQQVFLSPSHQLLHYFNLYVQQ